MICKVEKPQKAVRDHVDAEDKGVRKCDTPGGAQNQLVINKSGLYCMILSGKLPASKRFRQRVTAEVLPGIRKRGKRIPHRAEKPSENSSSTLVYINI